MPLSPRRYRVSAAAPKPAPATAGDLTTAAPPSCAVARGMSEATDTTNPLSPSTSPRHEQPGTSPEFRMTMSSGAAATVPAPTRAAGGAAVGAGGVVPPPLPHRAIVLPALEKTDERGVADATKDSGGLAASTDQSDETPSNIVQEVAEDVAEGVADMMQAIRGVFGRGKSDDGDDADATPPPPQKVVYGGGDSDIPEQKDFPVSAVLSRGEALALPHGLLRLAGGSTGREREHLERCSCNVTPLPASPGGKDVLLYNPIDVPSSRFPLFLLQWWAKVPIRRDSQYNHASESDRKYYDSASPPPYVFASRPPLS